MAERTISSLANIATPSKDDILPIVNLATGTTRKVTINNLVKPSDFSTFTINNLPDPVPISTQSLLPTEALVAHNGTEPRKVRLQNIYPLPENTSSIGLTFNNATRSLQGSVLTNAISTVNIVDGAITEAKIDPNAKIGGATGSGTDRVFYINDQTVNFSYNIPNGKNAMTAGPVTVQNGVTVTVPDGSVWTVV